MVFVIADLHLSHSSGKPMDIFGPKWENHAEKIYKNWQNVVDPEDTVVIPGDISWGMDFDGCAEDLKFIHSLKGKKIIGKGNHDYWWGSMKKLNAFAKTIGAESIRFLFNNAYLAEKFIVCGTRGWFTEEKYAPEDEKIVLREAGRLELSLEEGQRLQKLHPENEIIVFLHYPPAYNGVVCEPIGEVLKKHKIKRCFYGHIHSSEDQKKERSLGETRLYCVSADQIGFKPLLIGESES